MLTQFDEKMNEGCSLPLDGRIIGISAKRTAVVDADSAFRPFRCIYSPQRQKGYSNEQGEKFSFSLQNLLLSTKIVIFARK
jgi:hypothetical protein